MLQMMYKNTSASAEQLRNPLSESKTYMEKMRVLEAMKNKDFSKPESAQIRQQIRQQIMKQPSTSVIRLNLDSKYVVNSESLPAAAENAPLIIVGNVGSLSSRYSQNNTLSLLSGCGSNSLQIKTSAVSPQVPETEGDLSQNVSNRKRSILDPASIIVVKHKLPSDFSTDVQRNKRDSSNIDESQAQRSQCIQKCFPLLSKTLEMKPNANEAKMSLNDETEYVDCALLPTKENSADDVDKMSHDNCEFCRPDDHNYAKCVSLQPVHSRTSSTDSSDSVHSVICIDDDDDDQDVFKDFEVPEDNDILSEEFSTSFKTSEKGEKVMVVNPLLDTVNESTCLESPFSFTAEAAENLPVAEEKVSVSPENVCVPTKNLNTEKVKNNNVETISLLSMPAQNKTNIFSDEIVEGYHDKSTHQNVDPVSEIEDAELSSSECEWKIESVYSLATESSGKDSTVSNEGESHVIKSDELIKNISFSLKESEWKQFCKPCFTVLERLQMSDTDNPRINDIVSRCSDYCRTRTLRLMCHMNILNCNNHPELENEGEKLKKENVCSQQDFCQSDSYLPVGLFGSSAWSALRHTNKTDESVKLGKALRQLKHQITLKRRQMQLRKKRKLKIKFPTIRGVPIDPVSFVKTFRVSACGNRYFTNNGQNIQINKKGNVDHNMNPFSGYSNFTTTTQSNKSRKSLPSLLQPSTHNKMLMVVPPSKSSSASSSPNKKYIKASNAVIHDNPSFSTSSTAPSTHHQTPHNLMSVTRTGIQLYRIPSASTNPISSRKINAAVESLTQYLETNPELIKNKKFTYFFINIDGQQVFIKSCPLKTNALSHNGSQSSQQSKCSPTSQPTAVHNTESTLLRPQSHRANNSQAQILQFTEQKNKVVSAEGNISILSSPSEVQDIASGTKRGGACPVKKTVVNSEENESTPQLVNAYSTCTRTSDVTQAGETITSSHYHQGKVQRPGQVLTLTEEQRKIKRRKLEAKYPLPPGVIIKSEPISDGYDLDNNWSVTSEVDLGFVHPAHSDLYENTSIVDQYLDSGSNLHGDPLRTTVSDPEVSEEPPSLEDVTNWPSNEGQETDDIDEDPPFLLPVPIPPSLSFTNTEECNMSSITPSTGKEIIGHDKHRRSSRIVNKTQGSSPTGSGNYSESGYSSLSSSSSSETLASSSSETSIPNNNNNNSDGRPTLKGSSKIQQLKELLRKKELQVENLLKVHSALPQLDLDSV